MPRSAPIPRALPSSTARSCRSPRRGSRSSTGASCAPTAPTTWSTSGAAVFSASIITSTASRRAAPASGSTNPYSREQVVEILMRLMRVTGLREAYVEVILTRGLPPKGTRDPRACENRFYALVIPFVWIATEADARARHPSPHQRGAAHPAALGRPGDQELPLGRSDQGPLRILRAGLRHARPARRGRQPRRGAGLQRLRGQGGPGHDARGHLPARHQPADRARPAMPSRTSRR